MDNQFSFKCGFMQLKQRDVQTVKKEIMSGLGITTRAAWGQRLNGKTEPKLPEKEFIEKVFRRYGIIDVWGGITKGEIKDRRLWLIREVQETVHTAITLLGNYGLDCMLNETAMLSDGFKSGKIQLDEIVKP